jgi:hypothetical protein
VRADGVAIAMQPQTDTNDESATRRQDKFPLGEWGTWWGVELGCAAELTDGTEEFRGGGSGGMV